MNSTVKTSERFSKLRDLRASVAFFPLPYSPTSPSTFLLSPHFARSECEELPHTARISFAPYGNACYAGYPQTCQYTFCFTQYTWCILTVYWHIRILPQVYKILEFFLTNPEIRWSLYGPYNPAASWYLSHTNRYTDCVRPEEGS